MFRRIVVLLAIVLMVVPIRPAMAWSQGGHHLIAVLAFRQLPEQQRAELFRILKAHPRFEQDFKPPKGLSDARNFDEWLIGRAGYWPDVARGGDKKYHRASWHYQLGATLAIGNKSHMKVPEFPGGLPAGSTLDSHDLHIAQALELCKQILADKSKPDADRAIALCWIAHLVADAHQPCHAGSLYAESVFPEGDRGANSIKTRQRQNMHSLWDGLLGDRYNTGDILRRAADIEGDRNLMNAVATSTKATGMQTETWLTESRAFAKEFVYTREVLDAVKPDMEAIDLPEAYLKAAGNAARTRAATAAARLAGVWGGAL